MGETDCSSLDMRSCKYCGHVFLCIIGTISDMNYYKFNVLLDCGIVKIPVQVMSFCSFFIKSISVPFSFCFFFFVT